MFDCPWSTNQLKKLGRHISDGTEPPAGIPTYSEVMPWYDEVAAEVQTRIAALDWSPLLGDREPLISGRAKTLDTLRQKLLPTTPASFCARRCRVRLEAEMSLDEQDAVADALLGVFGTQNGAIKDLRVTPHSGYRAVHLWLRLPVRVEVQIRTHVQSTWGKHLPTLGDNWEIVSINSDSIETLIKTHARYFADGDVLLSA